MSRLALLAISLCTAMLAACGGGNSNPAPPPPSGNFSNASLSGHYAFAMSGADGVTGAYTARVGSIVADGAGRITSGLEDVVNLGTGSPASQVSFSGGTYEILSNGRGVMGLNVAGGGTLQLSFCLKSNAQGFLVQTDGNASTSGNLSLQAPSEFSASSLVGNYVFDFSGISFAGSSPSIISTIGQFSADGNGNVTGGVTDVNDGAFTPSGPLAIPASTYQLDASGNGTNFGRGTLTLNGKAYAFYIVDSTQINVLEEGQSGGSEGPAFLQTGAIPAKNSDFNGSFIFLTGGSVTTGTFGPIARLGRMTADGNGNIASVAFDENDDGHNTHISESASISNANYAIDTVNGGSGRGTFTFKNSSVGTPSYVFYMYSPTRAVIQDVTTGVVSDGTLLAQTGSSFTLSNLAGNYIFNWTGIQLVSPSPFEEDFVGQAVQTTSSSNNLTGVVDYVELGLNSVNNGATLNAGIAGTLTVNADGTQDNTYKIAVGGSSGFTVNFKAYFADSSTTLVLCSDGNRTTAGIVTQQAQ
jgi:hypothetical protein